MIMKILYICTHNSARSQMAEGITNHFFTNKYKAFSAGTNPTGVNPIAIQVMREIGIDISKNQSKSIKTFSDDEFDIVITVCDNAKDLCPLFIGKFNKFLNWSFPDPTSMIGSQEEIKTFFREVRDKIKSKIFDELDNCTRK